MKGPTPTIVAHAFWQTHFNPWKVNLFSAMLKMAEQTNEHIYLFLRTSSASFNPFFISTNTNFVPTGKFSPLPTTNKIDLMRSMYQPPPFNAMLISSVQCQRLPSGKMRRLQSVTPHILQHRYQETCKIIPKTPHTHQQPEQETPRKPHLRCIRPFAMEIQQQQLQLNNTADPRKPDHTANPTTVNTSNHSHVPLTIIPPQRFIPLQAPPSTPATTPQPASPSSRLPSNQINMTLNS